MIPKNIIYWFFTVSVLIVVTGCLSVKVDSGSKVCFGFFCNPQRASSLPDKKIYALAEYYSIFDRSIVAATDNFFERIDKNKDDYQVNKAVELFAQPGVRITSEFFDAPFALKFQVSPKKHMVTYELAQDSWVVINREDKMFQRFSMVCSSPELSDIRWKGGMVATIYPSGGGMLRYVIDIAIELEGRRSPSENFIPSATLDKERLYSFFAPLFLSISNDYEKFIQDQYGVKVNIVSKNNLFHSEVVPRNER